jgi:hypothetical protein
LKLQYCHGPESPQAPFPLLEFKCLVNQFYLVLASKKIAENK